MTIRRARRRSLVPAFALAVAACSAIYREPPHPAQAPGVTGRWISHSAAVADLDTLQHILETVHPNLYASVSRDSIARMRARIERSLPDSIDRIGFWLRIAPMVASLGDGHTSISAPGDELRHLQQEGALVFPPSVGLDDDGHLVVTAPFSGAALHRGDRIISINGRVADSLLAVYAALMSGESVVYRRVQAADFFRDLLMMTGVRAPFVVEAAAPDGQPRRIDMPGLSRDSLVALISRNRRQTVRGPRDFTYQSLGSGVGYMNFRAMEGDVSRFRTDIATMFQQVAADTARMLVIDLRANGGGDSRIGDALLDHFATTPYKFNAEKDWKMSVGAREYFKSWIAQPWRSLGVEYLSPTGRRMFGGPSGGVVVTRDALRTPEHVEPFFTGSVCVLIGPRTFSSASDMADGIKTFHLATLIGEETGGRGNSFGEIYPFVLPASGLSGQVSTARFVRANGDTTDAGGVRPDIEIKPTIEDRRAGRDAALERAKRCPAINER